ncbi:MAG: cytochrome-c peroxidase [Nitrospinae bacterium]|nr:cytochrome-c peroxidase [Nitrospinota bacterium]
MILRISFFLMILGCSVAQMGKAEAIIYEPVPAMTFPENNPWSKAKEELGRKLFFDPILSEDNSISCSSCHLPEKFWADGLPTSVGIKNQVLKRNSPSILNSGFLKTLFWDGRAKSLEEQALMPIQDKAEMNQRMDELMKELESKSEYREMFESAFSDKKITPERLAMAIATFERTVVTGKTAYDRYWQGDKQAISLAAIRGMKLFSGKAKCSICHSGPFFTDQQFHNIGSVVNTSEKDKGRMLVTGEVFHEGAFKTPGLRGISSTGPYMHDGGLQDLQAVIEFYDLGGFSDERKSPFISPIGLSANEKSDLLEFLLTLGSKKNTYPPLNQDK